MWEPKSLNQQENNLNINTYPFTCIQFLKSFNYKQFNNAVNYLLIFSILVLFSFSIFASSISNSSTFNEISDFDLHGTHQLYQNYLLQEIFDGDSIGY